MCKLLYKLDSFASEASHVYQSQGPKLLFKLDPFASEASLVCSAPKSNASEASHARERSDREPPAGLAVARRRRRRCGLRVVAYFLIVHISDIFWIWGQLFIVHTPLTQVHTFFTRFWISYSQDSHIFTLYVGNMDKVGI